MLQKLTPVALLAAFALSGCASIEPMSHKAKAPATPEAAASAVSTSEAWNAPAVVSEGRASVVLLTPYSLPEKIRNRKLSTELEPGATVQDVVAVLGKLGVPVIISDQAAAEKSFYLPHFNGTVGGLLSAVTRATDVWFTWHDGVVVVSSAERIGISTPQEAGFADQLGKGLEGMGIKERSVSWQAGMATMELTPSQFRRVRTFLERLTANAAVINLQVAVVNVTLNQSAKQGIDWEKLSVSAAVGGTSQTVKAWQDALGTAGTSGSTGTTTTPATDTTTPADTATAGAATAATALKAVGALGFTGNALQGVLFSRHFSFTGMFNFLQTYGQAETKQNVVLSTVGGNKVEFKSLTQIPYVSEVGVTTTSGTNSSSALGSSKTEKADDGITVEMTPMYDAAANTVTVDMKLSIKAVVAFNELSAGNQLGKLTQPTTADRSFTDSLRLRPGQTMVVGGLTYDSVSNNNGAPPFLQGTKWESQSLTVNRTTMFIVVRPTVTKLGQVLQDESGEAPLELLPPARGNTGKGN